MGLLGAAGSDHSVHFIAARISVGRCSVSTKWIVGAAEGCCAIEEVKQAKGDVSFSVLTLFFYTCVCVEEG
jgi:hypothetical protein